MKILGCSCIFPTPHIQQTARYYAEKLGFRAEEYLECEEPHICLYRGAAEIILLQAQTGKVVPNRQLYGYGYDAYLYTTDQDQLEAEFRKAGVAFARPLSSTDYQNREFVIEDLDGRWIAFGAKEDGQPSAIRERCRILFQLYRQTH